MVEEEKKSDQRVVTACSEEQKALILGRFDRVFGPRSLKSISENPSSQENDSWIKVSQKAAAQPDKSFEMGLADLDIAFMRHRELHDPRPVLSSNVNQQWDSSLHAFKADKSVSGSGNMKAIQNKPQSCQIRKNPSVLYSQ